MAIVSGGIPSFQQIFHGNCSDQPLLYEFKRNTRLASSFQRFTVEPAKCNRHFTVSFLPFHTCGIPLRVFVSLMTEIFKNVNAKERTLTEPVSKDRKGRFAWNIGEDYG